MTALKLLVWGWLFGNLLALGLFGFADNLLLRVLGAVWLVGGAASFGGIVGALAILGGRDADG